MTGRIALVALAVGIAVAAPFVLADFWVAVLIEGFALALMAASLDLLAGHGGMTSLGHAAFFGLGGYGLGMLSTSGGHPLVHAGIALAVVVAVAAIFGAVAVRTRGVYFLVITLAFGQVLWGAAVKWTDLTGGYNGIPGIARPILGPISLDDRTTRYYFVLAVAVVGIAALQRFVSSPVGLTIRGVHSAELRLGFLGYATYGYRLLAFVVAAAAGGVAGILNTWSNRFVSPDDLVWLLSAQVLLMVLLGGPRRLWGAAAAAVGLTVLRTVTVDLTDRWGMILGALYVVTVLVRSRERRLRPSKASAERADNGQAATVEVSA